MFRKLLFIVAFAAVSSVPIRLGRVASNRTASMLPTNVQVMDVSSSMLLGLRRNDDGTEDLMLYKFRR